MTTKNEVLLEGLVLGEPEWSHENHGAQFYRVYLQVPRLSGQMDLLPVLLPGGLAAQAAEGRLLRLRGQLRSFNNRSGVGSRLVLTVYSQRLAPGLDEPCNQITLSGTDAPGWYIDEAREAILDAAEELPSDSKRILKRLSDRVEDDSLEARIRYACKKLPAPVCDAVFEKSSVNRKNTRLGKKITAMRNDIAHGISPAMAWET